MKNRSLASLEALRAIAAILVVLLHAQETFAFKTGVTPFAGMFSGGGRGVDLFFVLSGFIISYRHAPDWGRPERATAYLFKRLCRIYPSVIIVTGVTAILAGAGFGGAYTAQKLDLPNIIASCLLLPQLQAPLVGVTWTLKYEMFFYLVFLFVILRPRLGWPMFALWQAAVGIASLLHTGLPDDGFWIYLQPVCLEFAMGMACAVLFRGRTDWSFIAPSIATTVLFAAALAFVTGAVRDTYAFENAPRLADVLWFGTCAALIIMSAVVLESNGKLRVPQWTVRLGNASYAIYLVHFSAIVVVSRLVVRVAGVHAAPLEDALCLGVAAVAVGFGIAFDRIVDRPLQGFLKRGGVRWASPQASTHAVVSAKP